MGMQLQPSVIPKRMLLLQRMHSVALKLPHLGLRRSMKPWLSLLARSPQVTRAVPEPEECCKIQALVKSQCDRLWCLYACRYAILRDHLD